MCRLSILALAGLVLSAGATPALAHGQEELKFKVDRTDLSIGESVTLAVGFFENGALTAIDSSRVIVRSPSGLVAIEPRSWGFNQITYFRMTALRAGSCRVDLAFTPTCGCTVTNSFAITVREIPRSTVAQIRILRREPCGTTQDVTGQTIFVAPGERVEFEAIGLCCSGNPVPLAANLYLSGSSRGFRLEQLGSNRAILSARGHWTRQTQLVAVDQSGSGIFATVNVVSR